jgi:hypothetical protein
MLVIRKAQIEVLGDEMRSRLHHELAVHARQFFPDECAAMSDEELLQRMRSSAEAAARWGLRSPRDVCRFANLSMLFGAGFDSNPRLKWIYEMLRDAVVPSRSQRLSQVYAEAVRRLKNGGEV